MIQFGWWIVIAGCVIIPMTQFVGERLQLYTLAVSVRLVAVFGASGLDLNPFNSGDVTRFERLAQQNSETEGLLGILFSNDWLDVGNRWITLLSLLYAAGLESLHVQTINALLAALTLALIRPARTRHRWVWIYLALSPIAIGIQASLLREAPVFLAAAVVALYLYDNRFGFGVALFAGAVAATFHPGMIPLLVLVIAARPSRAADGEVKRTNITVVIAMAAVASAIVMTRFGLERLDYQEISASALESRFARAERGRLAYDLPSATSLSPRGLLSLPLRIIYFFGGPFPNRVRSIGDILASIDGAMFLFALGSMLPRFIRARRALVVIALVGTTLIFSIAVSNFGTALRHRQKIVPIALVAAIATDTFTPTATAKRRPEPSLGVAATVEHNKRH